MLIKTNRQLPKKVLKQVQKQLNEDFGFKDHSEVSQLLNSAIDIKSSAQNEIAGEIQDNIKAGKGFKDPQNRALLEKLVKGNMKYVWKVVLAHSKVIKHYKGSLYDALMAGFYGAENSNAKMDKETGLIKNAGVVKNGLVYGISKWKKDEGSAFTSIAYNYVSKAIKQYIDNLAGSSKYMRDSHEGQEDIKGDLSLNHSIDDKTTLGDTIVGDDGEYSEMEAEQLEKAAEEVAKKRQDIIDKYKKTNGRKMKTELEKLQNEYIQKYGLNAKATGK